MPPPPPLAPMQVTPVDPTVPLGAGAFRFIVEIPLIEVPAVALIAWRYWPDWIIL